MNGKMLRSRTARQWWWYFARHLKRYFHREIAAMVREWFEEYALRSILQEMLYLHLKILSREKREKR